MGRVGVISPQGVLMWREWACLGWFGEEAAERGSRRACIRNIASPGLSLSPGDTGESEGFLTKEVTWSRLTF